MITWLPGGAALLVGGSLLWPATGAVVALPVPPGAAVALGPAGAWFALAGDGAWRGGPTGEGAPLPSPFPALPTDDHTLAHGFFHGLPTVVAVGRSTGEAACVAWDGAAWATPRAGCPAGDFAAIDAFGPIGRGGHWVSSHGEGHPGLALHTRRGRARTSPVADLYPFGPVTLHRGRGATVHFVTPCTLGEARPCAGPDGAGPAADAPTAWWSWRPGRAPRLRAPAVPADFAPAPRGGHGAWQRADGAVCVGRPGQADASCFSIP